MNGFFRHSVTRAVLCLVTILCLLLTACAAAAESEDFGYEIPEKISGKAPTGTVTDGQIIDLGGRKLEVIHTPGYQPSCIMLPDRENKLLFTGDMFYRGPMYCMFDDSCFADYVQSIRKVADLTKGGAAQRIQHAGSRMNNRDALRGRV